MTFIGNNDAHYLTKNNKLSLSRMQNNDFSYSNSIDDVIEIISVGPIIFISIIIGMIECWVWRDLYIYFLLYCSSLKIYS